MKHSTKFYLSSKTNKTGEKIIVFYFRYNNTQIVISTNYTVLPENWDKNKEKVTSKHKRHIVLNAKLQGYKSTTSKILLNRVAYNLSILPKDLKQAFRKSLEDENFKEKPTYEHSEYIQSKSLVKFIDAQVNLQANTKNKNTLKTYKRCADILRAFEVESWGKTIIFDDIDLDFYFAWKDFMIVNYKLQNNTINKYSGILKFFLGEAADRGLHQNYIHKSKKFSTSRDEVDTIYLNDQELSVLINLDLSSNKRLEKVRDLFYIGCKTGLRFSDLAELTDSNLDNNLEYIHISKTVKTSQTISIPIHESLKSLFIKIKKETGTYLPSKISNQKMNVYLKELGQMCGFDEGITITKKVGNKRALDVIPKSMLISTHTARRSFATNLYLEGIPVYEIMAITGHKTEKSFLAYIRITQKEFAKRLKDRWNNN